MEEALPVIFDYPFAERSDDNAVPVLELSHLEEHKAAG
jgi:hypothetical protein